MTELDEFAGVLAVAIPARNTPTIALTAAAVSDGLREPAEVFLMPPAGAAPGDDEQRRSARAAPGELSQILRRRGRSMRQRRSMILTAS